MRISKVERNGAIKGGLTMAMGALAVIAVAASPAYGAATSIMTVPAHAGHAWQPGSATCFSTPSFSNAVQNVCGSGQAWLIPITNVRFAPGSIGVTFFAGAKSQGFGVPHCRAIIRTIGDGNGTIGGDINITSINTGLGSFGGNQNDSFHLDCFFPASPTNQLTHARVEAFQ
jgi:hypothetical protein